MAVPTPEERIGVLEAGQTDLRSDMGEIKRDIRDMRSDLAGRPTWAVLMVIAGLGSLCTALGTALLMGVSRI